MKKLPHDFEAQSVELAAVMDGEKDPEVKRFLELLQRWSAEESPERWVVKPSEVVGWFRKEVLENRIGQGVDPVRAIQEWDEYLEDLAEGRKGGRFPSATGWRAALRFQFERIPPFKRTYLRESEEATESEQNHPPATVKVPKQPIVNAGAVGGPGKAATSADPYDRARRYLVLQVQRWNGYLDPEQVLGELEDRFQKGELLEAIRQWRDDEAKRKLDDEDKSDVKVGIAFRVKNLQANAATA